MADGESNGHMTDVIDAMMASRDPQKVKLLTPIRLESNISKQLEMLFCNNRYNIPYHTIPHSLL